MENLSQGFDLELERVVSEIRKTKGKARIKRVCIQLPDGLKPYADRVTRHLKEETGCEVLIWAGSCFGACDLPLEVERLGVDLLVQFGHTAWKPGKASSARKGKAR